MNFWNLAQIARAIIGGTHAKWLIAPVNETAPITGLSTDTRSISPGQVFFAIKGENFDANDFIDKAAIGGAALIVIDRESAITKLASVSSKPAVLLVEDSVTALQRMAAAYRDHLRASGTRVIAIAGSNGKTTTRHLIHSVLTAGGLTGKQSYKSFNNHIGVPVTLLSAKPSDHFVCVEVGTNHPGELDNLGRIVRPDAVVITSIGHEHMEFFKTLAGVAAEEASILPHVSSTGLAVIPGSGESAALLDPFARELSRRAPGVNLIRFGNAEGNDVRHSNCVLDPSGSRFNVQLGDEKIAVRLTLLGEHNASNALAAIAVARWMGLSNDAITAALANATPVEMRLNVSHFPIGTDATKRITLINDAYNANPDSMAAGLRTLCEMPATRRIAVIGDMRELGDEGPDLHRKIGRLIAEMGTKKIGYVILIGRLSLFIADALSRSWPSDRTQAFANWDDALPNKVAALIEPGDVVMIKASRGMGLERLVPAIERRARELA